ncbi:helix-turn-helix domain-containing protein [Paenibacillus puerhi]|uniref:helix-turn-helix domain-containing protein n=1 Tax=Paenibacillus puerhi TaxID=2692622 RepID=UPI001356AC3F|nr:helix-turn-helix transcriptional regulator [Paenibacillus puerhi]
METSAANPGMTILQYLALIHQVSYTQVCKTIGLTPQQFSDWVKKRRPVPAERMQAIAEYFKVDAGLLVDDHHYLRDLTPEKKLDVQIIFLTHKLETEGERADTEGYREKLARLEQDKKNQALLTRWAALLPEEEGQIHRLCEAVLNELERGNLQPFGHFLNEQEAKP